MFQASTQGVDDQYYPSARLTFFFAIDYPLGHDAFSFRQLAEDFPPIGEQSSASWRKRFRQMAES